MRVIQGILLTIVAIVVSGFAAAAVAIGMAEIGMLGSCLEGTCAYRAIYGAFPLLWILIFGASVVGYFVWKQRTT